MLDWVQKALLWCYVINCLALIWFFCATVSDAFLWLTKRGRLKQVISTASKLLIATLAVRVVIWLGILTS